MSLIAIAMNLLLAALLAAALALGLRLNRRLKTLRDSHDNFAVAVRELNAAAEKAEQGLSDLRAATDEAVDTLADRIEKGRSLAAKLERLISEVPRHVREASAKDAGRDAGDDSREKRLGALLAAAREARTAPAERPLTLERAPPAASQAPRPRPRPSFEDDLFDDPPLRLHQGGRP